MENATEPKTAKKGKKQPKTSDQMKLIQERIREGRYKREADAMRAAFHMGLKGAQLRYLKGVYAKYGTPKPRISKRRKSGKKQKMLDSRFSKAVPFAVRFHRVASDGKVKNALLEVLRPALDEGWTLPELTQALESA